MSEKPGESLTPLRDALERLEDAPGESFTVGVVATKDDAGVVAEVDKTLGRGWWLGAEGGWRSRFGGYVAAKLGWRRKEGG